MNTEQITYLAKITEKTKIAVQSGTRTSWQTQRFLHYFAIALGGFRVGKSIVLLDPILSKRTRTIFGKRPFSTFCKIVKRFHCHMSHRKRDDKNECIINFMIICTLSSKCSVFLKKIKNVILCFEKDSKVRLTLCMHVIYNHDDENYVFSD